MMNGILLIVACFFLLTDIDISTASRLPGAQIDHAAPPADPESPATDNELPVSRQKNSAPATTRFVKPSRNENRYLGMAWLKKEKEDEKRSPLREKREAETAGLSDAQISPGDKHGHVELENAGAADLDKRPNWADSDLSWMKRFHSNPFYRIKPPQTKHHRQNRPRRDWGDSGMAWYKRAEQPAEKWDDGDMEWMKEDEEEKRRWDESMAWIKRKEQHAARPGEESKRSWGGEDMAWLKRRQPTTNVHVSLKKWGDEGMAWL